MYSICRVSAHCSTAHLREILVIGVMFAGACGSDDAMRQTSPPDAAEDDGEDAPADNVDEQTDGDGTPDTIDDDSGSLDAADGDGGPPDIADLHTSDGADGDLVGTDGSRSDVGADTLDGDTDAARGRPVANDDGADLDEGATVSIDLVANDEVGGAPLDLDSITVIEPPSHGSLIVIGDGTVEYAHNGSETTSDWFTYTVDDDSGAVSNEATVNVRVRPVNDAPVANDDTGSALQGRSVTLDLGANDTDADDGLDLASITIVDVPEDGFVMPNDDGTVEYSHVPSTAGGDQFTYTIDDISGTSSNAATVALTVQPVVTIGQDQALPLSSIHAPSYLLGTRVNVPSDVTVAFLALMSRQVGPNVKMALYEDGGDGPGDFVVGTSATSIPSAGWLEIPVPHTPILAGNYYLMAIYDADASIGYTNSTSETVYFRTLSFDSALPDPFGSSSSFCCQEYNYYLVVY